jgi:hypothetical protein
MSNQEEMDKVLDDLEEKLPDEEIQEEVIEAVADDEVIEEVVEEVVADDAPPGFMGYDEWVKAGKDPKKFRGEEAYKDHYDSLQEVKNLKDSVSAIADGMTEWKKSQIKDANERIEKAIEKAKSDLAEAVEDGNVEDALAAERKITELNGKVEEVAEPTQEASPVIVEFQRKYPIVDKASPQFNQDFYDDVVAIQGATIDKLTGGNPQRLQSLTEGQIQRSIELAYREAKTLHPDKFASQKNQRRSASPASQKRQASKPDHKVAIRNFGASRLNKNDKNPAGDMFDLLMKLDPTGKKANEFAAKIAGEG